MNLDPSTLRLALLIEVKTFMEKKTKEINELNDLIKAADIYREIADKLEDFGKKLDSLEKEK